MTDMLKKRESVMQKMLEYIPLKRLGTPEDIAAPALMLASDGAATYPGVGLSVGVSRLVSRLLSAGLVQTSRPVPSAVVVAVTSEETRAATGVIGSLITQLLGDKQTGMAIQAEVLAFHRLFRSPCQCHVRHSPLGSLRRTRAGAGALPRRG